MLKGELGSQQQIEGSEIVNDCRKFDTNEGSEVVGRKGIFKLIKYNGRRPGKWKFWAKVEDKW